MRKLAGVLIAIVVIIVILLIALPSLINVNQYHDKIQAELQQKLHRPVKLGNLSLKLLPFSIRVSNAEIGEDPNFNTGRPFATAQDLAVSAKLLPLIRHEVDVNSVELVNPKIELVRNAQGTWNFASLQGQPTQSSAFRSGGEQEFWPGGVARGTQDHERAGRNHRFAKASEPQRL
jgi:AsmA protein